jgi:hypothetical protein
MVISFRVGDATVPSWPRRVKSIAEFRIAPKSANLSHWTFHLAGLKTIGGDNGSAMVAGEIVQEDL